MKLKKVALKKGFTIIEVTVTMLIIMIVSFGVQASILASIAARNVNDKLGRAEDLAFTIINIISRNNKPNATNTATPIFDDLLYLSQSSSISSPVLYNTANKNAINSIANVLIPNANERTNMTISANKIDNAKITLLIKPTYLAPPNPIPAGYTSQISPTKVLLTAEVAFKLKKGATVPMIVKFMKIISKPPL